MTWWLTLALLAGALALALLARRAGGPVLVIDAGHGGGDRGATWSLPDGGVLREADLVLEAAHELAGLWPGPVILTRRADVTLGLAERRRIAETGALLVSLHLNAYFEVEANGAEAWANPSGLAYALELERLWRLAGMHPAGALPRWRRVQAADSWGSGGLWIAAVTRPAILVEFGFLTNASDRAAFLDAPRRRRMLSLVVQALRFDAERI